VFRGRRVAAAVGFVLIALGIGGLVWSYLLAHGAHPLAQGWWEGTLQALGVGFVVGGLVDVLAITGLDGMIRAQERRRQKQISDAAMAAADSIYQEREAAAAERRRERDESA
jgi:hypothetical protein